MRTLKYQEGILDLAVATVSGPQIKKYVQKLKNKGPGEDNITSELIKYGGKAVTEAVHIVITLFWETEQISGNWRIGILCPFVQPS
jgi:hypothetical protein